MRKTSIVVIPLALLLVLAVTAGRGSSANQEESLAQVVAGLRGQLDELSTRVERLEQATGSYYPGLSDTDTSQVTAAQPQRSMVVAGIQPSEHTADYSFEIQQLRREMQSLESTMSSQRRRVVSLEGSGRGMASQLAAQRRLLNRYQRELGRKRQELRRLERASSAPKQIVVGHDGGVLTLKPLTRFVEGRPPTGLLTLLVAQAMACLVPGFLRAFKQFIRPSLGLGDNIGPPTLG